MFLRYVDTQDVVRYFSLVGGGDDDMCQRNHEIGTTKISGNSHVSKECIGKSRFEVVSR